MYYILYTSSEDNYFYYDHNKPIETTNKRKILKDTKDTMCIICWVETDTQTILLKQNTNYITFCECNTYLHDDCLTRWYCRTFSCPICRAYLIYDPDFTHRIRLRRKVVGLVIYGYNIVKQITNIISVILIWNITLNILCNIYLIFYPIDVNK